MGNKIVEIQNTIFKQINRLDDDKLMNVDGKNEIARANALTNASTSFIKAVNLQLSIINAADKLNEQTDDLKRELGICEEK